jgi:hypothetical protein
LRSSIEDALALADAEILAVFDADADDLPAGCLSSARTVSVNHPSEQQTNVVNTKALEIGAIDIDRGIAEIGFDRTTDFDRRLPRAQRPQNTSRFARRQSEYVATCGGSSTNLGLSQVNSCDLNCR